MAQPLSQLIPAVIRQLPEQVRPESKSLRSSEEEKLAVALKEPKICNLPEEKLKEALRYVFVLVGLKGNNVPVNEEKQMLLEYITENYGGHTAEEIKLAFKMAIQYKLPIPPKEVPCYENFSPAYFTRIMEAYRAWALYEVDKLYEHQKPEPKEYTAKEKLNINIDYAFYLLNQINKLPVKIGRMC